MKISYAHQAECNFRCSIYRFVKVAGGPFFMTFNTTECQTIFFSFIFSVWFYFCGSCKYIIPLNRLNPDFIRFHIEIWINSAAYKIHHLDLRIFGDTHKLQIKFKTHFQPNLNHMHRKNVVKCVCTEVSNEFRKFISFKSKTIIFCFPFFHWYCQSLLILISNSIVFGSVPLIYFI